MFKTLRRLTHREKTHHDNKDDDNKKHGKEKHRGQGQHKDKTGSVQSVHRSAAKSSKSSKSSRSKSICDSSLGGGSASLSTFGANRRHSCHPSLQSSGVPRRGSNSSCRSSASTNSTEGLRMKRLEEIDQLDKYIEHLKRTVDEDNISYIPNRLCCAQMLKAVLQRREREHIYIDLHSNRSLSESDIEQQFKSRLNLGSCDTNDSTGVVADVNNNKKDIKSCTTNGNPFSRRNSYRSRSRSGLPNGCSKRVIERTRRVDDIESEEEESEERVPGALLKAYDSDGTQHSAGSDSEPECPDNHGRSRSRSNSNSRRASIAVFPKEFEIF